MKKQVKQIHPDWTKTAYERCVKFNPRPAKDPRYFETLAKFKSLIRFYEHSFSIQLDPEQIEPLYDSLFVLHKPIQACPITGDLVEIDTLDEICGHYLRKPLKWRDEKFFEYENGDAIMTDWAFENYYNKT